jgi:hypothetical protein
MHAVVDGTGRVVELIERPEEAPGCGWSRELVELIEPVAVGDVIAYGADGVQIPHAE